ncbi:hypothetical protein P8C59_006009 [Phyllachora maydis]|uniref:Uncharacterized protein n=1 Tax=Phyllachora maydis TaxID=1825666 RepID=A0AAD9I6T6_9PEZI|nr:hypothetical protein P8C59_006009 [Phyllachora maydis]
MAYFDRTYTSSPVLAMPPQAAHQLSFIHRPVLRHPAASFSQSVTWPQQLIRTSLVAGRKRSRDEAAVNLDPPEKLVEPPVVKEDEDDWVYGPGMVLIKKSASYVADASSQSGTWVEEKKAQEDARQVAETLLAQQQLSQSRPSLRSNKSQRLDLPAKPASSSDAFPHDKCNPGREGANPAKASSDSVTQPVVDDFTVHLGIGWNRISDDSHIQAAARGWARYIENHFPVTQVKMRLESRGLQSYLVEANEGYFLFAEDLRQGRLVSKDAERAMHNLKASPVVFDSVDTMDALETATMPSANADVDMN